MFPDKFQAHRCKAAGEKQHLWLSHFPKTAMMIGKSEKNLLKTAQIDGISSWSPSWFILVYFPLCRNTGASYLAVLLSPPPRGLRFVYPLPGVTRYWKVWRRETHPAVSVVVVVVVFQASPVSSALTLIFTYKTVRCFLGFFRGSQFYV